jgi:hypothetical protein
VSSTGKLNIRPLGDNNRDEGVTVRIRISLKNTEKTKPKKISELVPWGRFWLIDWLFTLLRPAHEYYFSLIWRRHHCRWRAAKFRPMLSTKGHWAERDPHAVTRDLGFYGLIRRTAPFSRLLRHTRGCGGSILTRILTGSIGRDGRVKLNVVNDGVYFTPNSRSSWLNDNLDHIHSINNQTYQEPIAKYKEWTSNYLFQYGRPLQLVFTISQIN